MVAIDGIATRLHIGVGEHRFEIDGRGHAAISSLEHDSPDAVHEGDDGAALRIGVTEVRHDEGAGPDGSADGSVQRLQPGPWSRDLHGVGPAPAREDRRELVRDIVSVGVPVFSGRGAEVAALPKQGKRGRHCSIDDRAWAFEADDQHDLIADPVCNPVDESWQRQRDVEKVLMEGRDGGDGIA